jgi:hypothetical protein
MQATIGQMIQKIAGLAGTKDVDARTSEFIESVYQSSKNGRITSHLSGKQVEWIEDIHTKHFGGRS